MTKEKTTNKNTKLRIILWFTAVVFTLLAIYYQRISGPTYPKKIQTEINGKEYKFKLLRTYGGSDDCSVPLLIPDTSIHGNIVSRLFPSNKAFETQKLVRHGDTLLATIQHQPPAGKVQYYIELNTQNKQSIKLPNEPIVIRFKGHVPTWIIIIHVLFMFAGMMLANAAGLFAMAKIPAFRLYTKITLLLLLFGGFVLGPIVQKYAFGEFWTGIPFGWDLTDNKTLIGIIIWFIAFYMNRKQENRTWVIIASVSLIIVYSIPHSLFGSTLNHQTGKVGQGLLPFVPILLFYGRILQEKFHTKYNFTQKIWHKKS